MKNYFYCLKTAVIFFALLNISTATTHAQCKGFAKQSASQLNPYDLSGKIHSVVLQNGDHAEMSLSFYSGQSYRIIMNSGDAASGVSFLIKDADGKLLFNSALQPVRSTYDFVSESTQALTIEMIASETKEDTDVLATNCVCVMVGSKPQ